MSLPEQASKVATSTIEAMKGQPMLLMVLVLNLIIFAAITWAVTAQRADQQEIVKMLLEQNARQIELLQKLPR